MRAAENLGRFKSVQDPDLLDQLPELHLDLAELPVELQRELFDALQLRIDYNHHTHTAHGQITLTELSTGAVDILVRPDVTPVIDLRAIRTGRGAAQDCGGTTGLPRGLRVEHDWVSPHQ